MPDIASAGPHAIRVISSMATKALLRALARAWEARSGAGVAIESVGGVDAAMRVQAGDVFDVVVLAADAIERLVTAGHLVPGTQVSLARSGVAVAVRAGAPRPKIHDEPAVRRAVLAARSIGTSTGPSGVELGRLFERWGIADRIRDRMVTAPPGVPVGALVARGEVELGFQQLSELARVEGVDVVGPLPAAIQIVTTFSAAVGARARQPEAALALVDFMASPGAAAAKVREGMDPA